MHMTPRDIPVTDRKREASPEAGGLLAPETQQLLRKLNSTHVYRCHQAAKTNGELFRLFGSGSTSLRAARDGLVEILRDAGVPCYPDLNAGVIQFYLSLPDCLPDFKAEVPEVSKQGLDYSFKGGAARIALATALGIDSPLATSRDIDLWRGRIKDIS